MPRTYHKVHGEAVLEQSTPKKRSASAKLGFFSSAKRENRQSPQTPGGSFLGGIRKACLESRDGEIHQITLFLRAAIGE